MKQSKGGFLVKLFPQGAFTQRIPKFPFSFKRISKALSREIEYQELTRASKDNLKPLLNFGLMLLF